MVILIASEANRVRCQAIPDYTQACQHFWRGTTIKATLLMMNGTLWYFLAKEKTGSHNGHPTTSILKYY